MFSQIKAIKEADRKVKRFEYLDAIKIYERLDKKGQSTPDLIEKLANLYYDNASYAEANKWFAKLYLMSPQMKSESHYRYAQTLKTVGQLEQSKIQIELYKKSAPNQIRAFLLNSNFVANSLFEFSNIKLLPINSELSDFGATLRGDTIVFSSARGNVLSNAIYSRTGQYYAKIYESVIEGDGKFSEPKLLNKGKYSKYNETTPAFSKDGKTMYYTENKYDDFSNEVVLNGEFELCKSVFENGKWVNKGRLSFEQKDSVRIAHPALSLDGKSLYFASDMPGTNGDSDLFKIEINEDGSFGKITHLPSTINTEGRETYPFITQSNTLIFASDGHPGMGGLDLFSIDLTDPNAKVIHLSDAVNSPYDDFALVINNQNTKGYYTSNKSGGMGDDDVYSFNVLEKPNYDKLKENLLSLDVTIRDDETNKILNGVSVSLIDAANKTIAVSQTNSEGKIDFKEIKPNSIYRLLVEKDNFISKEVSVRIDSENTISTVLLNAIASEKGIADVPTNAGYDIASDLKIDKIFFDFNQYTIREEAKSKLDNLVAFLNLHPEVRIEIGSHTDSRASKAYNLILSQKRAQATLNYLVKRGIKSSRLIAVGYGESKLVNNCSDGVKCTEKEHEENRRSSFLILK